MKALLIVVMVVVAAPGVSFASPSVDADAVALFDRVMSPYCPGRTLATCGSTAAEELRADVKRQLASGISAADVEEALYRKFGDSIRGVPEARGVGAMLWVLPCIVLAGSVAWMAVWLSGHVRRSADSERGDEASQELLDRLDDELARL